MQIKVNGEIQEVQTPLNVEGLAALLQLSPSQVAVERNRQIVPKSLYAQVMLGEGDEIEIVQFIGEGEGGNGS